MLRFVYLRIVFDSAKIKVVATETFIVHAPFILKVASSLTFWADKSIARYEFSLVV